MIPGTTFDKMHPPYLKFYEKLKRLTETKKMKLGEYCKWVLTEHVRNQEHVSKEGPKR